MSPFNIYNTWFDDNVDKNEEVKILNDDADDDDADDNDDNDNDDGDDDADDNGNFWIFTAF